MKKEIYSCKKIRLLLICLLFIPCSLKSFTQILDLNYFPQEKSQWCWAACSQTILDYYNISVQQCDIAEFTRTHSSQDFGEIPCCDTPGACNSPNYLYGFGGSIADILANWKVYSKEEKSPLSYKQCVNEFNQEKPFIFRWGWINGGGHFLVATGMKDSMMHYIDPLYNEGYKISHYDEVISNPSHNWTHSLLLRYTDEVYFYFDDYYTFSCAGQLSSMPVEAYGNLNSDYKLFLEIGTIEKEFSPLYKTQCLYDNLTQSIYYTPMIVDEVKLMQFRFIVEQNNVTSPSYSKRNIYIFPVPKNKIQGPEIVQPGKEYTYSCNESENPKEWIAHDGKIKHIGSTTQVKVIWSESDNPYLIFSENKNYTSYDCTLYDTLFVKISYDVNDEQQQAISLSPNPCSETLTISNIPAEFMNCSFTVQNTLAQTFTCSSYFSDNSLILHTSSLPPGVYIISIKNNSEQQEFSFIKI